MLNHYEYFPSTEVLLIVALSDVVVFVGLQLAGFSFLQLDWIGRAQLARHNVQLLENRLNIRVKRTRENSSSSIQSYVKSTNRSAQPAHRRAFDVQIKAKIL